MTIKKILNINFLNKIISLKPVGYLMRFFLRLYICSFVLIKFFPPLTFIFLILGLYYFYTKNLFIPITFLIYFLISFILLRKSEIRYKACSGILKTLFGYEKKFDIIFFLILIVSTILVLAGVLHEI